MYFLFDYLFFICLFIYGFINPGWLFWAKSFSSQGKFKEAQMDYEKMQQIKGFSDALSKNIQNLHIADSMRRQGSLV